MFADDVTELHEMADKIGLERAWFQETTLDHYDLTASKRLLAVKCGACQVSTRETVAAIVKKTMEVDKLKRYSSMGELREALDKVA